MDSKDDEVPLREVLSSFLTDDGLKDLTLVTIDGEKIRANRYVLSARSSVMRKMLLGTFAEAGKPEVKVGFTGRIVQEIVEYIHTDSCDSLNQKDGGQDHEDKSIVDKVQTEKLISLMMAASYYNLPGLVSKVKKCLSRALKKAPRLSLVMLGACRKEGASVPSDLADLAWSFIRNKKEALMDAEAIASADVDLVEEILKDEKSDMTEYDHFVFLSKWIETNPHDRQSAGKELAKILRPEKICPHHLSTSVASSRLFASEQINEAYKQQALSAAEFLGARFEIGRSRFVWKRSLRPETGSRSEEDSIDTLKCAPITDGIKQWQIKILSLRCEDMNLGIVCTDTFKDNGSWLGNQMGGWSYCDDNFFYCEGKTSRNHRPFLLKQGSDVYLTLNLSSSDVNNGALYIESVYDEDSRFIICTDLRSHLKSHPGGFLPAVSNRNGSCVELVSVGGLEKM